MPLAIAKRALLLTAALSATATLAACGGGGSSSTSSVTNVSTVAPPPPPPRYEAGVYRPSSEFKGVCNPEDEKFFLRSLTNETYLWYDEVPDLDPTVESEGVVAYFDRLVTDRRTANGNLVDNFHFSISTEEFERSNSGQTFGYGAEFAILEGSSTAAGGRDIRIAYVLADEDASDNGVVRGAKVISVDGEDAVFGNTQGVVDALNDAIFPDTEGEEHVFEFELPDGTTLEATLTAATVEDQPVLTYGTFTEGGDENGEGGSTAAYLHLTTFSPRTSEQALFDAFTDLSDEGVENLYLDLRYNGGGLVAVACQLGFMIAGEANTSGRTCTQLLYNDKIANGDPFPFIDEAVGFTVAEGTPLPTLNLDKTTILSTRGTCSASELTLNALLGIDVDVDLVGDQTCGKPYGFSPESNCGTTYFTIQFASSNDKGFTEYPEGFFPTPGAATNGVNVSGCPVDDDFDSPLGALDEALLSAAVQFEADGTCPGGAATAVASKTSGLFEATGGIIDARPDAIGQEPHIILQRLRKAGLITDRPQ